MAFVCFPRSFPRPSLPTSQYPGIPILCHMTSWMISTPFSCFLAGRLLGRWWALQNEDSRNLSSLSLWRNGVAAVVPWVVDHITDSR